MICLVLSLINNRVNNKFSSSDSSTKIISLGKYLFENIFIFGVVNYTIIAADFTADIFYLVARIKNIYSPSPSSSALFLLVLRCWKMLGNFSMAKNLSRLIWLMRNFLQKEKNLDRQKEMKRKGKNFSFSVTMLKYFLILRPTARTYCIACDWCMYCMKAVVAVFFQIEIVNPGY